VEKIKFIQSRERFASETSKEVCVIGTQLFVLFDNYRYNFSRNAFITFRGVKIVGLMVWWCTAG
jgi:hypothetical protein